MARDKKPGAFGGGVPQPTPHMCLLFGLLLAMQGGSVGLASEGHSSHTGPEIRYLRGT